MKYGLWPLARSISAMAMATGVLPLPPAVRLPTQITGKPGSNGLAPRTLSATLAPYNAPSGASRVASAPPFCQKSGARIEQVFQRLGGAVHRARQCRRAPCRRIAGFFRQFGIGQKLRRLARD